MQVKKDFQTNKTYTITQVGPKVTWKNSMRILKQYTKTNENS